MEEIPIISDLKNLSCKDFYLKHIVRSKNWYFSSYLKIPDNEILDKIDHFKEVVTKEFNVSFHSALMVGSAKTGYSLSPKKFPKLFGEGNNQDSDIDIAIVSNILFHKIWDQLRTSFDTEYTYFYKKMSFSLFRGFINDKEFLRIPTMRSKWNGTLDSANKKLQDSLNFVHKINYRIYRSWEDLEAYQILGLEEIKNTYYV